MTASDEVVDLGLLCRCYNPARGRCYRPADGEDGRCSTCRGCACSALRRALPNLLPEPDPDCCVHAARRLLSPAEAASMPPVVVEELAPPF